MTCRIGLMMATLILIGCDKPQTATLPESPVQELTDAATTLESSSDIPWTSYPYPDPAGQAAPAEFTAKVIKVIDGDTIDVQTEDRETVRVHLNGIDAPERDQPFGEDAEMFLSLIADREVRIETYCRDKYGHIMGEVYCDLGSSNPGESNVNFMMVANGRAWHYVKDAPDREDLAKGEKVAREIRLVIWSGSHKPVPPWQWRTMSKEERDESR